MPCCSNMWDILYYLLIVALFAGALLGGGFFARAYLNGTSPVALLFGPRPERRLDVIEHANVDGRRRLLLIRRDDVEHLIMTGGPVDVVIETGIGMRRQRSAEVVEGPTPIFTRQPRSTFGQAAVGEQ